MQRSDLLKSSPPMFQSRFLDRFTRVHPVVPVLIYGPVIAALLYVAVGNDGWWDTAGLVLIGYCVWTLFEYWLHRIVFHFEPEEGIGAKLHWMIHGVHHDHPNDPLRLVMPPAASIPLAIVVVGAIFADRRGAARPGRRGRLPPRVPDLRRDPLRPAPPRAQVAARQAPARAAHAPSLPGRREGLRHQRALLGFRFPHLRTSLTHASARTVMLSDP